MSESIDDVLRASSDAGGEPQEGDTEAARPPAPPMTQPVDSTVTITELVPVDIKKAWPTEPAHFTPWLLDNAAVLSEVLGVEVELDAREHKVGTFSLDLIGRVSGSDKIVIVENQYGSTDHTHLGQIMTYAGGTEPAIVVWIAESFRDEHRSALDWLNEHTPPKVGFFGIALSAVRLHGAPAHLVAPKLDLVCKPNEWDKLAKASTSSGGATGLSPTNALYKRYWERFAPLAKERGWTNATAPAQNWWSLPAGVAGVTWGVSFSMFGARSELNFGSPEAAINLHRLQELRSRRDALWVAFGSDDVIFDDLPDKVACRLDVQLQGPKVTDESCWASTLAWMIDTQERLRAAVKAVGGIPAAP